jgi:predicted molibdopterin-dependent oxidoreductase YjgC
VRAADDRAMAQRVIRIAAAPSKPAEGSACNGCGVCCLAEPCPVGVVVSRRVRGACRALRWEGSRYRCGVLADARSWRAKLLARWIAAGRGCDSSVEVSAAA